ncbi:protein kinase domain containing protein [Stylonychia lemnae]|uniref:Protein kinase domain containing protein n=1 Tax=Stylonychia lemnae TaxID=5949 RepID=A0A078A684_STYLE|nr:protein kinase domain containing protein [Stylonychia lemnae]|eukprot:CDW77080.1 protein kinase domain containing protein [Stylonychia lemnae]
MNYSRDLPPRSSIKKTLMQVYSPKMQISDAKIKKLSGSHQASKADINPKSIPRKLPSLENHIKIQQQQQKAIKKATPLDISHSNYQKRVNIRKNVNRSVRLSKLPPKDLSFCLKGEELNITNVLPNLSTLQHKDYVENKSRLQSRSARPSIAIKPQQPQSIMKDFQNDQGIPQDAIDICDMANDDILIVEPDMMHETFIDARRSQLSIITEDNINENLMTTQRQTNFNRMYQNQHSDMLKQNSKELVDIQRNLQLYDIQIDLKNHLECQIGGDDITIIDKTQTIETNETSMIEAASRLINDVQEVKISQKSRANRKLSKPTTRNNEQQRQHKTEKPSSARSKRDLSAPTLPKSQQGSRQNQSFSLNNTNHKDYEVQVLVGQGAFGSVQRAIHRTSRSVVAIKSYEKNKLMSDQYRRDSLKKEIEILKKLDHPNIIKLYDSIDTGIKVNLIMEYVQGRSLYSFLRKKGGVMLRIDEKQAKLIFKQVAGAVAYLHEEKIVHRDLKLENILIDDQNRIKIIDFGFSVRSDKKLQFTCGTPHYMAPELAMKKDHYGQPTDIWAMGVMLFIMLTGRLPFYGDFEDDLYRRISTGKFKFPNDCKLSSQASNLIKKMLKVEPSKRIKAEKILDDPWLDDAEDVIIKQ